MEYIKKEWKKLGSICLILVGSVLIIEHIYSYSGIDLLDVFGHEWLGILFILSGILIANRWGRMKFGEAISYAKLKIRSIFK